MPAVPVFDPEQMPEPGAVSTHVIRRVGGSPALVLVALKPVNGSV